MYHCSLLQWKALDKFVESYSICESWFDFKALGDDAIAVLTGSFVNYHVVFLALLFSSFNASLDCIRNHLSRCGSPLHRDLFDLATGEMQYRFYQFMCRDNPERQAFFTHASCIREHVFAVDQAIPCLNNYLLAFENVQEVNAVQPNYGYALTDWIRTICCAHQAKRDCTNRLAEEHCGNQAAQAFDIFFEQIHFGFFSMICRSALSELDPNSEVCQRALPNRGKPPKGLRSDSAVSKLLVSYFPFNYVTQAQRKEIYRVYRKRLMEKGKNFN